MTKLKQLLLKIQEHNINPEIEPLLTKAIEELDAPAIFKSDTRRIDDIDNFLRENGDYVEILLEEGKYVLIRNTELISERNTSIRNAIDSLVNEKTGPEQ